MGFPEVALDVSYARVHTIFWCNGKSAVPRIHLIKNRNSYEILFDDKNAYDEWMLKLRKVCILGNFEKRYEIAEIIEKRGDISVKFGLEEILLQFFRSAYWKQRWEATIILQKDSIKSK